MHTPLVIHDMWSPSQCSSWIDRCNALGWHAAAVETASGLSMRENIRRNSKREDRDHELAHSCLAQWAPLVSAVDTTLLWSLLFPVWRSYKYEVGDRFIRHRDGAKEFNGNTSTWTVLLYLNDDFLGGDTVFYPETTSSEQSPYVVTPRTGTLVVFPHKVWHASTPISEGVKYVLRTDAFPI